MDKLAQKALLYDFYGELLTEHQKSVYEEAVFNDMSLSEIGEEFEISRQGAHDILKRCDKILEEYENKLHLVQRFMEIKKRAETITGLTNDCLYAGENSTGDRNRALQEIAKLSEEIVEEL